MKITKYILSFAAAAGLLAACQTPEVVQIASPENVVPASLHELDVTEIAISATNQQETVSFSWEAADYGAPTQISYSLEAALDETSKKVTILSGLVKTEATVTYEDLNRVLFNDLEVPEGQPTGLKIYVGSVLYAGSSVASYPKVYSEPKSLTVTVTAAEKVYPMIYVIGDFNGWKDGTTQELFEFTPESGIYSGMLGFGGKAANGWKIKGTAEGWDDTCNWGLDGDKETPAAEAPELTLITSGGSKDIKIYSKNFYNVTFDNTALTLKVNLSFDQIGVIGSFNEWGGDIVMSFNAEKQRFYADVEFAADGQFKLRADADWTLNWGAEAFGMKVSNGDGNLEAKAGNYRIYANMNNPAEMTIELNKAMYGQEEPTAGGDSGTTEPEQPEQPVLLGWGLVGEYNGWGAEADVMLASDGTFLVAKGVALSGQVKFRKDSDWATNFGAPGETEPVEITVNTELALVANGKNFTIAEGTYDVYLDEANAKAWFINDGSYPGGGTAPEASEWGVVGDVNGWGASPDIVMYKTATEGLFVAHGAQITAGGIKIRANNEWNDAKNYGLATAGSVENDHAYDLICGSGSQNMTIAAGTYDIWFDLTNSKVYIMTPGKPISEAVGGEAVAPNPSENVWGIVGDVNGWGGTPDIEMQKSSTDGLFVAYKVVMPDGGFKIRANNAWNDAANYGLETAGPVEVDHVYNLVCSGGSGNMNLVAGTYDIWFDLTNSKVYIMTPDKPISEAK